MTMNRAALRLGARQRCLHEHRSSLAEFDAGDVLMARITNDMNVTIASVAASPC
jgi:hypothetical protein